MARDKILRATRTIAETRLQDLSSLDVRIRDIVSESLVEPITERLGDLEDAVQAIMRGAVYETDIQLRHGGRSGHQRIVPVQGFHPDTIGQPVIVQPFITEGNAVLFHARVVNRFSMDVAWFSVGPAPRVAQLVYLIG